MNAIEKRARELLDANAEGYWLEEQGYCVLTADALKAVIAALTPPNGYVLSPVIPTKAMMDAAVPAGAQDQTGRRELSVWSAMLAARPEVPNVND